METETLERLVRRMIKNEASQDAGNTQGYEIWWSDLVLTIIDATDADRDRVLSAIADFMVDGDEGS